MYYVYILTNQANRVLYIGMTNDLYRRLYEHKNKLAEGFTAKFNLNKLVYFIQTESAEAAILYEKKLKGWTRQRKIDLIAAFNPGWNDLACELSL